MSAEKALKVGVVRLPHGAGLPLPAYQSEEAAGLDIVAAVANDAPMTIQPGARALVPTGLILELPRGSEAQVRPRSGLAFKHGLTVLNSPGTIDSDYRGELKVLLVNLGHEPFVVRRGERIAQIVVATVTRIKLAEKASTSTTGRGSGGFGSTGTGANKSTGKAAAFAKPGRRTGGTKRKSNASGTARTGRQPR